MSNFRWSMVGSSTCVATSCGLLGAWVPTFLGSWEPSFLGRWVGGLIVAAGGADFATKSCWSVTAGLESVVWSVSFIPANGLRAVLLMRPPFGRDSHGGRPRPRR